MATWSEDKVKFLIVKYNTEVMDKSEKITAAFLYSWKIYIYLPDDGWWS